VRSDTVTVQASPPELLEKGSYALTFHMPEWTGLLTDVAAWFVDQFGQIAGVRFIGARTVWREREAVKGYIWQDKPELTYIAERHIDLIVSFGVDPVATSTIIALALAFLIVLATAVIVVTMGPQVVALGFGVLVLLLLMAAAPRRREE